MCRRHYHQWQPQSQALSICTTEPYQRRQRQRQRRNSCNFRPTNRNTSTYSDTLASYHPYVSEPRPLETLQGVTTVSTHEPSYEFFNSHSRRNYRGPCSLMAALILGAIGLTAVKIQEKREKKKAEKAALVRLDVHHNSSLYPTLSATFQESLAEHDYIILSSRHCLPYTPYFHSSSN